MDDPSYDEAAADLAVQEILSLEAADLTGSGGRLHRGFED
jgi:hypothetical protein